MKKLFALAAMIPSLCLAQGIARVPSGTGTTTNQVTAQSGSTATVMGQATDGATAVGVILDNTPALANPTAKVLSVRGGGVEKFYVGPSGDAVLGGDLYASSGGRIVGGAYAGTTEFTLFSWFFNAAAATGSCPATGTGCIGHKLPAQAFTVTGLTGFASVASGGGAANTVFTITDGTNTCTATIACNSAPPSGTSSTGTVKVTTANGAGTGCVYAANATLTVSVTTAGCTTTQPTFKNVDIVGKWQ